MQTIIRRSGEILRKGGVYLLAALAFLIIAFYNDYPILDNDTGTYLASGYTLQVPKDRPIFYGLFLRFFSHGHSVWIPVFAQSLLLTFLVVSFIRTVSGTLDSYKLLLLVLLTALGTTAGWYASQLLPDVFTAMLFLALFGFLFRKNSSFATQAAYWLIALWAVIVHNSHLVIAGLFTGTAILYVLLGKRWQYLKKMAGLVLLCVSGWMLIAASNYRAGYGFTFSPASHVFLMGRLVENGTLKYYLDRNCASGNYRLCRYKDELPTVAWEYVWNPNSPLQKTGGWDSSKTEHLAIMKDMASKPQYIALWTYKSILGTLRQLATTDIDEINELEWIKFDAGTLPYDNIKNYIPFELNEVTSSKQYTHTLGITYLDRIYILVLVGSSLLALAFRKNGVHSGFRNVYVCLVVFLVINAFVTANFANVLTRLNSRVIWLLPFVNLLYLYHCIQVEYRNRYGPKTVPAPGPAV